MPSKRQTIKLFIPSSVDLDFNAVNPIAALTSSWHLYTGGRIKAARSFADAGIAQAQAEREGTLEQQEKLLATLYFGHLLAGDVLRAQHATSDGCESMVTDHAYVRRWW